MSVWLPRNYEIRNFTVENCNDVTIEKGALRLSKNVVNIKFANLHKLTVEEDGLVPFSSNRRRGIVQLEMNNIQNLNLNRKSVGGAQNAFKSVKIINSNFSQLAFGSLFVIHNLDDLIINKNTFNSIPNLSFVKISTKNFEFNENVINGFIDKNAFIISIDEKAQIMNNQFNKINGFAFNQISSQVQLDFSNNHIKEAAQNALNFNSTLNIQFERIRVGLFCECQLGEFDPIPFVGNNQVNGDKLKDALVCLMENGELELVKDYLLRDECTLDVALPRGRIREESICSLDHCECKKKQIQCDCQNIHQISIGMKDSKVNYALPKKTLTLSIINSPKVKLSMNRVSNLNELYLGNIKVLHLGPDFDAGSNLIRRNVTIENSFIYDSIESNTFLGSTFNNIVLRNISVDFIQRKAFNSIFNMSQITMENVDIKEEIGTEAFFNISTENFSIKSSKIEEIRKFAFNVKVQKSFQFNNVTVQKLGEMSFYSVSGNPSSKVDLTNIQIDEYEEGALMISNNFLIPGKLFFANNKINMECSCEMHKIATKRIRHHHTELINIDVSKLIECRHDDDWIAWTNYDLDECDDHEDHDHFTYNSESEILSLSKMAVIIASVLAGLILIAVVIFTVACWSRCFPRKPLIGPILPIGEDELSDHDSWQRVSFKRGRSEPGPEYANMTQLNPYSAYYYNTDPMHQAGLRRVSAIPAEIMRESGFVTEEAGELPPPYNDRTLDIIQDKKLGRQSLQAF